MKLDIPKDTIKLCANSICNNAHLDWGISQENVEFCIEKILWPYLSLPQEQEAKPQIEKVEPLRKGIELVWGWQKVAHPTTWDVSEKVDELVDTVNKQQEQINSLIDNQQ